MATFGELQTRVRTRLIDLPTAVTNEVPTLVNEAIRQLQEAYSFDAMKTEASFTTDPLASPATLLGTITNFKAYRPEFPYLRQSIGPNRPLNVSTKRTEVDGAPDATDRTGSPEYIFEVITSNATGAKQWHIWPPTDSNSDYSDGEYRIRIPHYVYLPVLVSDGDENWFTNNAVEYIIFKATAEGFALDWDEQRMAFWLQRADNEKKRVILEAKKRELSVLNTWVPHHKGVHSPTGQA